MTSVVNVYDFGASAYSPETVYTKTVAVNADMSVGMYPEGAVYWYGIFPQGGAFGETQYGTEGTWVVGETYISCSLRGTNKNCCRYINQTFDVSGYTTLHSINLCRNVTRPTGSATGVATVRDAIPSMDASVQLAYNIDEWTEIQVTLPTGLTNVYAGFGTLVNNQYDKITACEAIWFE